MAERTKYILDEADMPSRWYNVVPDLPEPPPPPLHPGTREPVGPDDLAPLFPQALIAQEVSTERYIDIPEEVLDVYRLWRPSPLFRARRLEKALGTPARIYYKYEGVSPVGSHKPNTAVPQAFYNAAEGVTRLTTETGAGQWGSALAFACATFGLECEVWQVRASFDQKPYRKLMMETFGATVHPSPSELTESGRAILAADPGSTGSLGIAISEAVEQAAQAENTRYALGSVLNHVLLHQTIIGEEALKQFELAGDTPDVLVGCTGGGSTSAGSPSVPAGETHRPDGSGDPRGRACRVPDAHPREVRVRLRGHRGADAVAEDAHARSRLHPRPHPRGWPALSRDVALDLAHLRTRADRRGRHRAGGLLRHAAFGSPVRRASSPRPSRPTRSPRASRKRCAARKPGRRR